MNLVDEVAAERAAQGLPPRITDPVVLSKIATLLSPDAGAGSEALGTSTPSAVPSVGTPAPA